MSGALLFMAGVLLGALAGFIAAVCFKKPAPKYRKTAPGTRKKPETMKAIVWACTGNGFAWIWCSYLLAALDKTQIAETLSTAAVTEIIGAVLAYAIKSLVENLSKNNRWPDKSAPLERDPLQESEETP